MSIEPISFSNYINSNNVSFGRNNEKRRPFWQTLVMPGAFAVAIPVSAAIIARKMGPDQINITQTQKVCVKDN